MRRLTHISLARGRGEHINAQPIVVMGGGNCGFDLSMANEFRGMGQPSPLFGPSHSWYNYQGTHAWFTCWIHGDLSEINSIFCIPIAMEPMLDMGMQGGV